MADRVPRLSGDFAPGAQIAGYRLAEQIGWGGMAVVYRALDVRLDRWVALKILAPEIARDESFRQRFISESRAAAAVDHPHIIPVFEAGEAGGALFIAMRYVAGGRRPDALPPARPAGSGTDQQHHRPGRGRAGCGALRRPGAPRRQAGQHAARHGRGQRPS